MINHLLDRAQNFLQEGRLEEAGRCCMEILASHPDQPDVLHCLGVIAHRCGHHADAVALLGRAMEKVGDNARLHGDLGDALLALGQLDQAGIQYRQALRLQPRFPEALTGLGRVLLARGEVDLGLETLMDALEVKPDHIDALIHLGQGLADHGQKEDAIQFFLRALDLESEHVVALHGLGCLFFGLGRLGEARECLQKVVERMPDHLDARTHLGVVLQRLGAWNEARDMFDAVLMSQPGNYKAHNNFGSALLEQGLFVEAGEQFKYALSCKPDYFQAINNLGVALQKMGNVPAALDQFRQALREKPDYFEAANNRGLAYQELGLLDEALDCFRQAQRLRPDFADAHFNEGVVWLTRGDFDRGWRGYEWRMGMAKYRDHHALHPISAVTGIAGRSFLVFCEQGFGDDIQFIRYVGWLREAGARVVVACPGELARLFVTVAGVDHWVVDNDIPPACDYQVLLLSLPLLFGARMGEFPASVPYLSANPERMDVFRQRLEGGEGVFKVGLVWRGNPKHFHDRHRSMSPALFSRLKQLEGVYLIGLQKGATHEELAVFAGDRFLDLGGELHDFADTAAVVAQLDLVIAVDTSVAHLAGALGRPVWVLLPAVADWRWLLGREDSPWYPTMRLWRQSSLGDWSTVMDKVVEQLQSVIQSFAGCGGTTLLSHVNSL